MPMTPVVWNDLLWRFFLSVHISEQQQVSAVSPLSTPSPPSLRTKGGGATRLLRQPRQRRLRYLNLNQEGSKVFTAGTVLPSSCSGLWLLRYLRFVLRNRGHLLSLSACHLSVFI